MNSEKFLLGVLPGVETGAFVGISFTPDKSSRKRILNKGGVYANSLKEKFDIGRCHH